MDEPEGGIAHLASGALGAVARIPIPGTGGLVLQLRKPASWSGYTTSTVFITDNRNRVLRLDYGFNRNTGNVEFHWNGRGTHQQFGISNHTPAGRGAAALHQGARFFRHAGRVLLVAGIAFDAYSIAVASNPVRRTVQVGSAWAAAFAGCRLLGAGGAIGGSAVPAVGTAIGGIGGCLVGGIIGYAVGEAASGAVYDWAEGTVFHQIEPDPN